MNQAIVIEQRDSGEFLLGAWPERACIAEELYPMLIGVEPKVGEDFQINLSNASALYRLEAFGDGYAECRLIRGHRAVAS